MGRRSKARRASLPVGVQWLYGKASFFGQKWAFCAMQTSAEEYSLRPAQEPLGGEYLKAWTRQDTCLSAKRGGSCLWHWLGCSAWLEYAVGHFGR
jgi:hypothetical protein